jgi:hypothetical protein
VAPHPGARQAARRRARKKGHRGGQRGKRASAAEGEEEAAHCENLHNKRGQEGSENKLLIYNNFLLLQNIFCPSVSYLLSTFYMALF